MVYHLYVFAFCACTLCAMFDSSKVMLLLTSWSRPGSQQQRSGYLFSTEVGLHADIVASGLLAFPGLMF